MDTAVEVAVIKTDKDPQLNVKEKSSEDERVINQNLMKSRFGQIITIINDSKDDNSNEDRIVPRCLRKHCHHKRLQSRRNKKNKMYKKIYSRLQLKCETKPDLSEEPYYDDISSDSFIASDIDFDLPT